MKFTFRKLLSKFIFASLIIFLGSGVHAQLYFTCSDGPDFGSDFTQNVTVPGPVVPTPGSGFLLLTQIGDVFIYSMTPDSATAASWHLFKYDDQGFMQTVMAGGTVSNTLFYTAVDNSAPPGVFIDSINGSATVSRRCIPAKDVAPALGIPTLSQWGLFGTGLLLTLAAAFHFRPRRRRFD